MLEEVVLRKRRTRKYIQRLVSLAAIKLESFALLDITQRIVVIPYRSFGTDILSRKVSKELLPNAA
jgi:hypothetical protein